MFVAIKGVLQGKLANFIYKLTVSGSIDFERNVNNSHAVNKLSMLLVQFHLYVHHCYTRYQTIR